ncbi:MAG: YihY/virulence factor BrkB family protein [Bacteroidia bacterium]
MNIKNTGKKIGLLFKNTFLAFMDDNAIKLSASLSYYTIFSLAPLLLIIIFLCGIFFGTEAVRGEIFGQINGLVGNQAAVQIQDMIKNVKLSSSNTFAAIIGVITLIFGASGVFAEIQDSMNYIWGLKAKPKRGLIKFLKNRLMSFSMIGSVGFLLIVGLIVNALMDVFSNRLQHIFPGLTVTLFHILNVVVLFVIITLLFAIIFKSLPDGKIAYKDAFIGASFTSFLFMIGKFAIGAYLGSSAVASTYGVAGSLIIILLWVYYTSIILYFGAEFTKIYAINYGKKITPNAYAVYIDKHEVQIEPKVMNIDS